jgi:hypothetical protein
VVNILSYRNRIANGSHPVSRHPALEPL